MLSAASRSPQFRFVSTDPGSVNLMAPLQMVRRVDAAGAFSWRAPKGNATLEDVQEFATAQGGDLELVEVQCYRGNYRFTFTVG